MTRKITRREAISVSAAAAAGLLAGSVSAPAPAAAESATLSSPKDRHGDSHFLPDVWGEEFLLQWSPPDTLEKDLTTGSSHVRLSCAQFGLLPRNWDGTPRAPWEEQVKAARDAGYTAVESGVWFWNSEYVGDSDIREIKEACRRYDVEFYTLHAWANIIHPDPQEREKAHRLHIQAVEMAERLGMSFILTHTGGRSGDNKDRPHPLNHPRATWEMSVAAVKKLLRDTSGSSVGLAFEAVNSCNNNTPQSHLRLKQDVGDDRVKTVLDPANMLHPGTIFRTTELLDQCFDLLGEEILYAHAKDKVWNEMLPHFEGVALGEGMMDYETYLARLSRMEYPRVLYIEHLPDESYAPSKKHIEETAKRLGVRIYS